MVYWLLTKRRWRYTRTTKNLVQNQKGDKLLLTFMTLKKFKDLFTFLQILHNKDILDYLLILRIFMFELFSSFGILYIHTDSRILIIDHAISKQVFTKCNHSTAVCNIWHRNLHRSWIVPTNLLANFNEFTINVTAAT